MKIEHVALYVKDLEGARIFLKNISAQNRDRLITTGIPASSRIF